MVDNYTFPTNSLRIGNILLDSNLIIVLSNTDVSNLLAPGKGNLLGSNLILHLKPSLRVHFLNILEKLEPEVKRSTCVSCGPQEFRLEILIRNSTPTIYALSIQDLTEQREEDGSMGLKPNFIMVSHELRAPLFNIQSFLEFLYEYETDLTRTQRLEFLEIATSETERLGRVVSNMLDAAKLKNEQIQKYQLFSGEQLVTHILRANSVMAFNKRMLFSHKFDIKEIDSLLSGSYDLVAQVLTNLVTNSLKFTYPYGLILLRMRKLRKIDIFTSQRQSIVRISVIDNGIGISPVEKRSVFARFSRAKNTPGSLVGTGLGLALVRDLLTGIGSRIRINTYLRRGCHISFDMYVEPKNCSMWKS